MGESDVYDVDGNPPLNEHLLIVASVRNTEAQKEMPTYGTVRECQEC